MNKKRKLLKRIFALVGVVAVFASLLLLPVGAWQVSDIPFYNYLDLSKIPTVSRGERTDLASIIGVDNHSGVLTFEAYYTGSSSPYVPTSYLNLTLRDVLPDVVSGVKYILSGNAVFYDRDGNEVSCVEAQPLMVLKKTGAEDVRWYWGNSLTITEELLTYNVMLYSGKPLQDLSFKQDRYISEIRLWVNKQTAYDFCSNDISYAFSEESYMNGYNDGYMEASATQYISREGTTFSVLHFGSGGHEWHDYNDLPYNFDGISIDTFDMKDQLKFLRDPVTGGATTITGIKLKMDFLKPFYATRQDFRIVFGLDPNSSVSVTYISEGKEMKKTMSLMHLTSDPEDTGYKVRSATVDWVDNFGLPLGAEITSMTVSLEVYSSQEPILGDYLKDAFGFSLNLCDTNDVVFEAGRAEGIKEGKDIGYDTGYQAGVNHTKNTVGATSYKEGYENGFLDGRDAESKESGFAGLISSVIDVPIKSIKGLFNFNILGLDMSSFVLSMFTVCLCITIVKKVI